jgi:hypothetical protein
MRCGHEMPTCGRCARRNKPGLCVYHPAPLTKPSSIPTSQTPSSDQSSPPVNSFSILYGGDTVRDSGIPQAKRLRYIEDREVSRPSEQPFMEPVLTCPQPAIVNPDGTLHDRTAQKQAVSAPVLSQSRETIKRFQNPLLEDHARTDVSSLDNGAAFVHHSSVLTENELSIGILPQNGETIPLSRVSQSQVDRGATVLTLLNDFASIQRYIEKWVTLFPRRLILDSRWLIMSLLGGSPLLEVLS